MFFLKTEIKPEKNSCQIKKMLYQRTVRKKNEGDVWERSNQSDFSWAKMLQNDLQ